MVSEILPTNSGNMPSLFVSRAPSRSQSLPGPSQHATNGGPYVRRGSAALEALTKGMKKKSEIEVFLEGKDEFVRTYSTFDQIKGHVELKFEKDTLIGDMLIMFEGQSNTYVERVAAATPTTGRTTGKHTFLRVQQPISPDDLPENMLAKANTTYTVPFIFTVPDRLLPYICSHKVDNEEVKAAHLQLPPSLGDPMLSGEGNILMDDLAPEMAKISYCIKAKLGKASPTTGRLSSVEEKSAKIRIVPTREEAPPLSVDAESRSYALRKEKNVRKGVFKIGKKLGRLTAEVSQPRSLRLSPPSSQSKAPVSTMAAVTLRFDPASANEQPPQMANLAAKLRAFTFFGAAAYKMIPEVTKYDHWSALHSHYPESVSLSCRNIGSVAWTKHEPENRKKSIGGSSELTRQPSNLSEESAASTNSSASIPAASSAYDSDLPFFTAKVLVPISLPFQDQDEEEASQPSSPRSSLLRGSKKMIFVPTFHSCIISRSYTLELGLSFHPVNAQGNTTSAFGASSMTLRTPIQISQEGSSLPPVDPEAAPIDLSLIEGTDEYDEAMARHLDQELNFMNPFAGAGSRAIEPIPEYEAVQTGSTYANGMTGPARNNSIAIPPSANAQREQPPEYYSPFRTPSTGTPAGGRRHTVVTHFPTRPTTNGFWFPAGFARGI